MVEYKKGKFKVESYIIDKTTLDDIIKLVDYLEKNPLGILFKVTIGNEEFDI